MAVVRVLCALGSKLVSLQQLPAAGGSATRDGAATPADAGEASVGRGESMKLPDERGAGATMTYSILGNDASNGDLGVAVQSKFPGVGSLVPYGDADVDVVASTSCTHPMTTLSTRRT